MKIHHNREIQVISFLDERYYTTDQETYYPATSTILEVYPKGYAFQNFLKQVGMNVDELVRKASEQGSKMHDTFHQITKGYAVTWVNELTGKTDYTAEEWQMVAKFYEFIRDYQPIIIEQKYKAISEKLGIGDTLDLVCEISGELWLIDYKAGSYLYETDFMRLAMCVELWNEIHKQKIQRAGILHVKAQTRGVDKRGKVIQGEGWQIKEPTESLDTYADVFGHSKAIWQRLNPTPKPKNKQYPDSFCIEDLNKQADVHDALNNNDLF